MKGNKGFTLVELLAIIVILGIIAVITTPVILGVIDDTRKDAAADKAWGTIDAIKLAYAQEQVKNNTYKLGDSVTITNGADIKVGQTKVRISGQKPESGSFLINDDGNVEITDLTFDGYKCNYKTITSNETTTTDYAKIECTK